MLTPGAGLQRCITRSLSVLCRPQVPLVRVQPRCYSTPPILGAPNDEVQVKVKIGLDRHVNLAIRQPRRPEDNAPIILYLHRGLSDDSLPSPSTNELALGANAVTVRLDYRVSKDEPYPFPIHAVLAGYDWIRLHLLRQTLHHGQHISERDSPRLGVCGELAGGSLATMLALTECHGEKRGAIKAAAVGNPIVDWTALVPPEKESMGGTTIQQNLKSRKKQPKIASSNNNTPSLDQLLTLRAQYFNKPEKYFDAFASPLLFFRTPRYAVPGGTAASPSGSDPSQYIWLDEEPEPEPELVKKRLSHRNYPPLASDLVLPRMRVELGEESSLREQGIELVELWQRSHATRRDGQTFGAQNKIEILTREGAGLWGDREMLEVGSWFGEVLRGK